MSGPTAGKILQHYYALRAKRGTREPAYYRKNAWKHAENYLAWCGRQEIDPIAFLDFRFRGSDHSGYVPRLDQLRRNKLVPLFRAEWMQDELGAEVAYDRLKARAGTREEQTIKALRVLTSGQEAVKYPYALTGRYKLCLTEQELTGGFHPESRYCPTCPEGVRCAAALYQRYGFDVVALRAGRLHALPPKIAAAAVR